MYRHYLCMYVWISYFSLYECYLWWLISCVSVEVGIVENTCVHIVHWQRHLGLPLRVYPSDSKEEVRNRYDGHIWPVSHLFTEQCHDVRNSLAIFKNLERLLKIRFQTFDKSKYMAKPVSTFHRRTRLVAVFFVWNILSSICHSFPFSYPYLTHWVTSIIWVTCLVYPCDKRI